MIQLRKNVKLIERLTAKSPESLALWLCMRLLEQTKRFFFENFDSELENLCLQKSTKNYRRRFQYQINAKKIISFDSMA